ncbi:MAG: acyl-CoA thioesterase [Deltaproteobacteria bacterium]|nr:acyl-CoA thioesterase [Deltaproteobacteria bacterium]MBW2018337.1 acyl-CoA thioesterase [Deltaproteobacteria bacterium]MBW2128318.1 acyl-CoA thioesterase [Deltaproteobacteria bacterium]MBW2303538.1 acyl-CoA thioesterase [Deltaproteobacteria bacterium]
MRWMETEETVRFNEVDEWGMAWYGHYLAWFEVGRMFLLRRFDLLPRQMVELGYIAPVVRLECHYKHPAASGDRIIIRTTVERPEIAALNFRFQVLRKKDRRLLARGATTQVLLTTERKMIYWLRGELKERVLRMVDFCNRDQGAAR